jgi:hypothetical protein
MLNRITIGSFLFFSSLAFAQGGLDPNDREVIDWMKHFDHGGDGTISYDRDEQVFLYHDHGHIIKKSDGEVQRDFNTWKSKQSKTFHVAPANVLNINTYTPSQAITHPSFSVNSQNFLTSTRSIGLTPPLDLYEPAPPPLPDTKPDTSYIKLVRSQLESLEATKQTSGATDKLNTNILHHKNYLEALVRANREPNKKIAERNEANAYAEYVAKMQGSSHPLATNARKYADSLQPEDYSNLARIYSNTLPRTHELKESSKQFADVAQNRARAIASGQTVPDLPEFYSKLITHYQTQIDEARQFISNAGSTAQTSTPQRQEEPHPPSRQKPGSPTPRSKQYESNFVQAPKQSFPDYAPPGGHSQVYQLDHSQSLPVQISQQNSLPQGIIAPALQQRSASAPISRVASLPKIGPFEASAFIRPSSAPLVDRTSTFVAVQRRSDHGVKRTAAFDSHFDLPLVRQAWSAADTIPPGRTVAQMLTVDADPETVRHRVNTALTANFNNQCNGQELTLRTEDHPPFEKIYKVDDYNGDYTRFCSDINKVLDQTQTTRKSISSEIATIFEHAISNPQEQDANLDLIYRKRIHENEMTPLVLYNGVYLRWPFHCTPDMLSIKNLPAASDDGSITIYKTVKLSQISSIQQHGLASKYGGTSGAAAEVGNKTVMSFDSGKMYVASNLQTARFYSKYFDDPVTLAIKIPFNQQRTLNLAGGLGGKDFYFTGTIDPKYVTILPLHQGDASVPLQSASVESLRATMVRLEAERNKKMEEYEKKEAETARLRVIHLKTANAYTIKLHPQQALTDFANANHYVPIKHIKYRGMEVPKGYSTLIGNNVFIKFNPDGSDATEIHGKITNTFPAGMDITDDHNVTHTFNANHDTLIEAWLVQ